MSLITTISTAPIYDLFLDRDKQYSCAYFVGECGLDEAQLYKKRHLAAKLALSRGQRILDIGSGWGGLALYLAHAAEADVTGITLSDEQLKVARQRAFKSGLARMVRFEALDYRRVQGPFDRIVSVGMFEHVGVGYYDVFFKKDFRAAFRRRRRCRSLHRPLRCSGGDERVHRQVHIPRRLYPGA